VVVVGVHRIVITAVLTAVAVVAVVAMAVVVVH
jgi:hypothetical protein